MNENSLDVIRFGDLSFLTGSFIDAARWIIKKTHCVEGKTTIVSHININNYFWLQHKSQLMKELKENCTLLFDGIGMRVGAFISGQGWPPDLNGTDLIPLVLKMAAQEKMKIYLLGAENYVVKQTAENIRKLFPGIRIAGLSPGYFDIMDENHIVENINRSKAQILLISMGFVRQEEFALRWRGRIHVPLIWNTGGLFDFVSGSKPRAPLLLRRLRLEWLFRFLLEPRRMWHRNFVAAPWSIAHIAYYSLLRSSSQSIGKRYGKL
jgi:N-acetylglucosaminyldiphosphoundecaprenol N-acetyl-beta-D-mannosaminyltransferase